MSDAKEGIVLDKDGKPLTSGPSPHEDVHRQFRENFKIRFGGNAMRTTASSLPGKIILGAIALVMLAVGAFIVFVSLIVFFFKLCLRAVLGGGRGRG